MKKGYWVVRAKLIDTEEYSKYINLATEIIKKYGGQFIVREAIKKNLKILVLIELLLSNLKVMMMLLNVINLQTINRIRSCKGFSR